MKSNLSRYVALLDTGRATNSIRPYDLLQKTALSKNKFSTDNGDRNSLPPKMKIKVFETFCRPYNNFQELDEAIKTSDAEKFKRIAQQSTTDETTNRVFLSSIHNAKGKEYLAVAVLGPQDSFPDKRAVLEEERRGAYVAVTRAKEKLLFCASTQYCAELAGVQQNSEKPSTVPFPTLPTQPYKRQRTGGTGKRSTNKVGQFRTPSRVTPGTPYKKSANSSQGYVPAMGDIIEYNSQKGSILEIEKDGVKIKLKSGANLFIKKGEQITHDGRRRRLSC